jgi:hypothetical protein
LIFFYGVFELSSPRNARKRDEENRQKSVLDFVVAIFCKLFDTIFLQNVFFSVFESPSLRNTRKRNKTKKIEEKLTSTFCKNIFFMVFLNSPYRETPKNVLKKSQEKKIGWWVGGWVWDLANIRGGPSIFLAGPSSLHALLAGHGGRQKKKPTDVGHTTNQRTSHIWPARSSQLEYVRAFAPPQAAPAPAPRFLIANRQSYFGAFHSKGKGSSKTPCPQAQFFVFIEVVEGHLFFYCGG